MNSNDRTLWGVLCHHARHTPHHDFLVEDKDVVLSYADAFVLSSILLPTRIRSMYPSLGAQGSNQCVVLLSHNNTLCPLLIFACWYLSISVVPVSPSTDPSLWTSIVDLVGPSIIVTSSEFFIPMTSRVQKNGGGPEVLDITSLIPPEHLIASVSAVFRSDYIPSCQSWIRHSGHDFLDDISNTLPIERTQQAITLFTSSAIDRETLKCVTYTHAMLFESSERAMLMLGGSVYSSVPKRHLGWLPLSHCFEFCVIFCGLVMRTGGAYLFFDRARSSPSSVPSTALPCLLLAALEYHYPVSTLAVVPSVLIELLRISTQADLDRLRALHSLAVGGARTPEDLFQWAASQGIRYFDCSGATEAAGTICIRRAEEPDQRKCGLQIIPGLMGVLEKDDLQDNFGLLIIRGTYLPSGYNHRKSDAYHFDPDTDVTTYHTGDLYEHHPETPALSIVKGDPLPPYDPTLPPLRGLSYVGRNDDLVVFSSGIKINALSLERIIDDNEEIVRSAVVSNPSADGLLVLVQPHLADRLGIPGDTITQAILVINQSLPYEKRICPDQIFHVHELPTTTKHTLNRKLVKKTLSKAHHLKDIPHLFPPPHVASTDATRIMTREPDSSPSEIYSRLVRVISSVLRVSEEHLCKPHSTILDFALSSLAAVQLSKALMEEFQVSIPGAHLYGAHTIEDLCGLVQNRPRNRDAQPSAGQTPPESNLLSAAPILSPSKLAIHVSGVACRYPGGIESFESFGDALFAPDAFLDRVSQTRPEDRWPSFESIECDAICPMRWLNRSVVDTVHSFAQFFRISPHDARSMSPNARLALQIGYNAIEDAGISPQSLSGKSWGVFTTTNDSGWRERQMRALSLKDYAKTLQGSADDAVGARLSYFLNLTGPAMDIKTACSSSAVAVHQACNSIRNGDCDAAIVIAVTTHFYPAGAIFRASNGIVSPSGMCAPFCECADGFVASEGAVAIVLQRSYDALTPTYGSIRASTVTQDGASRGFFAPNPNAQRRLLHEALSRADCTADDITLLEAHGTGTQLGDSIEIQAINDVFRGGRNNPLYVGSVKAVLGHTEECAGLTGVLKALVCFEKNCIPPQPRLGALNEQIDFEAIPIIIPFTATPFSLGNQRHIIGVSSFGLSGTLAHLIVEETPAQKAPTPYQIVQQSSEPHIFIVTANSPHELLSMIKNHIYFLEHQHLQLASLATICRTTQVGRDHLVFRQSWVVDGWKSLRHALRSSSTPSSTTIKSTATHVRPRVGIWFGVPLSASPLITSQHPLYQEKLEYCRNLGWAEVFDYFMHQFVLVEVLKELGCIITAVGGEGIAEYMAAVVAGVLPESVPFRLYQSANGEEQSARCFVRCPDSSALDEFLTSWSSDELRRTGQYGVRLFCIRGAPEAVAAFCKETSFEVLSQSDAWSEMLLGPFPSLSPPRIPIISGHLGESLDEELALSLNYWDKVQEREVNSCRGWEELARKCDIVVSLAQGDDILEVLGDTSISLAKVKSLEGLISELFMKGCEIDWVKFSGNGPRARMPTYTWAMDK